MLPVSVRPGTVIAISNQNIGRRSLLRPHAIQNGRRVLGITLGRSCHQITKQTLVSRVGCGERNAYKYASGLSDD
jgi:hypothetical protein